MKKRYYLLIGFFILLVFVFLIIISNSPANQIDKIKNEEITYSNFSEGNFAVLYPDWEKASEGDVELSVTKGYCTVSVNTEKIPGKQWYEMIIDSVKKQEGDIIASSGDNLEVKYSSVFQNHTFISDNKIYTCAGESTAVTISCLEEFEDVEKKLSEKIFSSATCNEEAEEFRVYEDVDFKVSYPDWGEIPEEGEQRLLGVSKGVCSILVDRHNALPKDIFNWLIQSLEDKTDYNLLEKNSYGDEYSLVYQFPYEDNTLTASTKIFYCNYQSYITQIICVEKYAASEEEEMKEFVLENSICKQEYLVPSPEKIEKEKEEVKEKEPDVIEEIEEEIVKTNVGEEFGIDEEMVVYFINNNVFFNKILKDFPNVNLVINDEENNRELDLKVSIDEDGKIFLLEDGKHEDADVSVIVPLRDALNIFNNAANINPITLISFAVNVKTEPVEVKNEIIQKVLSGGYN